MSRCECCTTTKHVQERVAGGRFAASLCKTCSTGAHGIGRCLICREVVWHCARVAHMAKTHPLTLQKLQNDPFKEIPKPRPEPEYIGTFTFPGSKRRR